MPGIGIISNPYAGVNRRNPEHNTLVWYVLGNRGQFEVTQSPSDLIPVCDEFKRRNVDHIGIIGGDGTISLALQAIYEVYGEERLPKILVMRGGTMNVVALNLGIFGKPANIMSDFLDLYHRGAPLQETPLRTMKVNGKLGFLFGNGAASRFLNEFYKNKKSPTRAGIYFAKLAAGGVVGGHFSDDFKAVTAAEPMEIATSPTPLPSVGRGDHNYSIVFASTLPHAPFGFTLCHQLVGCKESVAELVAVTASGRGLVSKALQVAAGIKVEGKDIRRQLFERCTIRMKPGSEFTIDGELFRTDDGQIQIELGPTFVFCSPYGKVGAK